MSPLTIAILIGSGCLAIGVGLLLWFRKNEAKEQNLFLGYVICWLLIALVPALLLFTVFPQSTMSGRIRGFSMSGAVALFVFVWWFGTRSALKAAEIDKIRSRVLELEADLQKARNLQAPGANAPEFRPLPTGATSYPLRAKRKKKIGLVTGSLLGVKVAEIWVNSENTNMQMSRFYERSISGAIRHMGALRDRFGKVAEDVIMKELTGVMGDQAEVAPGTVLMTGSGALKESHGVKKIFHVASVRGEAASGYKVMDNIGACVTNALTLADTELRGDPCKTILFPLLGTGAGKARPEDVANALIMAAIEYLESHAETTIETVYFLAWGERELEVCKSALASTSRVMM
jgi:O-acetyl-ADP-ribose deacetylase (regulator of RNase III)